ncbi:MAG TPA: peptidase T [Lachnospiraceae bacterium]|nr:peptidase T [uncultured Lachnoclostridium sp.]HAU86833.1 peptidase T [Lachnospiraceae bacterium]
MSSVLDRFLSYVVIDTESVEDMECFPSSEKQKVLGEKLVGELKELGLADAFMDEYGYVFASIPANTDRPLKTIGFIAHMDTAPAMSGHNVNPRIVEKYDGTDIILNQEKNIILSPEDDPEMLHYIGQDLVVTDGLTLLGADDKAGIAEIMTMAQYFMEHPEAEHGEIKIAFSPDEEVGRGMDFFDAKKFGADFAYTVDGGVLGEIEYENFNAAGAKLYVQGSSIHPGSAKNRMKNAILLAMEFQQMLPVNERPEFTENYEGFYLLNSIQGDVERAVSDYIIRDHSREQFEAKKVRFQKTADYLNDVYGDGTFRVEMKDSYYNMKEKIEPHMHLIENAKKAMEAVNVVPNIVPIRGGTDGARLSFMGIPCPNLCAGGHNFHGKYEYVCVQSMEKIVEILVHIVEIYAQ